MILLLYFKARLERIMDIDYVIEDFIWETNTGKEIFRYKDCQSDNKEGLGEKERLEYFEKFIRENTKNGYKIKDIDIKNLRVVLEK